MIQDLYRMRNLLTVLHPTDGRNPRIGSGRVPASRHAATRPPDELRRCMSDSEHAFTQASQHVSANAERGRPGGDEVRVAGNPIIVLNMRHPPTGKHYTSTSGTTHVSHAVKPVNPTRAVPSHRHEPGIIGDEIG
ncbi:hypothetical protein LTR91_018444 [Friedmanniomyces endolithicus]|uniref:Uncharacterized protein n=1 Tax=Friedmanniomyces endolithicus TaxID=329885 RepID=A0AAN6HCG5_9PEZI|nr:hypothetical protein LTS09_007856 [Friedmanniomyces endolithicus]KAK0334619.1 hypothetical protein LTR94_016222 [Friedmanniomyces endolithicus]KAK0771572.1 hypothetical protein LTR59_016030 [Friedmanniomyces endolithicus]KAK0787115.1 hypothetical protein LTR38_011776 [Friedmanniomyces endolithicus]KAK0794501.1 hypothetical protein LTR75_010809 [Friedmanniomyces endolithicus]